MNDSPTTTQTPAQWLEDQFDAQWERDGMEWESESLSTEHTKVTMFHLVPRDENGHVPESYVSPGNMFSLRTDTGLSYVGIQNQPTGLDDESYQPQELVYL